MSGEMLWMLIRTDNYGNAFLLKEGFSMEAAMDALGEIESRGTKPHGQFYEIVGYTAETRDKRVAERGIRTV